MALLEEGPAPANGHPCHRLATALAVLAPRAARIAIALVKKLHDAVVVIDVWRSPDLRSHTTRESEQKVSRKWSENEHMRAKLSKM